MPLLQTLAIQSSHQFARQVTLLISIVIRCGLKASQGVCTSFQSAGRPFTGAGTVSSPPSGPFHFLLATQGLVRLPCNIWEHSFKWKSNCLLKGLKAELWGWHSRTHEAFLGWEAAPLGAEALCAQWCLRGQSQAAAHQGVCSLLSPGRRCAGCPACRNGSLAQGTQASLQSPDFTTGQNFILLYNSSSPSQGEDKWALQLRTPGYKSSLCH